MGSSYLVGIGRQVCMGAGSWMARIQAQSPHMCVCVCVVLCFLLAFQITAHGDICGR
jgi:hypothetical protein